MRQPPGSTQQSFGLVLPVKASAQKLRDLGELSGLQLRVVDSVPGAVDVLDKRNYRIGRATSTMQKTRSGDLVYDEQTVSAEHAELVWHERERSFVFRHISHTNHTVVNGVNWCTVRPAG